MQLNVTGHHIEVTPSLHDYVSQKMERLERHFDHVTNVHVILSVEKSSQNAEAPFHISGGNLFADAQDEDMYAAIDAMTDKLDRQIKKHKEKLTDHHRAEGEPGRVRRGDVRIRRAGPQLRREAGDSAGYDRESPVVRAILSGRALAGGSAAAEWCHGCRDRAGAAGRGGGRRPAANTAGECAAEGPAWVRSGR